MRMVCLLWSEPSGAPVCALGPASRFQPPGGSPGMARNLGKMVAFLGFGVALELRLVIMSKGVK